MKYEVNWFAYMVNTLHREPRKMAHVIRSLEQFLKEFLREPYTKQLKDF